MDLRLFKEPKYLSHPSLMNREISEDEDRPPVTLVLNKIDKASEMRWAGRPNDLRFVQIRSASCSQQLVKLVKLVAAADGESHPTSPTSTCQVTSREREFKTHGLDPNNQRSRNAF